MSAITINECHAQLALISAQLDELRKALLGFKREVAPTLDEHGRAVLIKELVAAHFGLTPKALNQTTREGRIAWPRHLAMYLIRKHTGLTMIDVGRMFGRDHTLVSHACMKLSRLLSTGDRRAVADNEVLNEAIVRTFTQKPQVTVS